MDVKEVSAFFDACAATWNAERCRDDDKIEEILNASRVKAGDSVLDIACGTGVLFDALLARGVAHITGVDISSKMLKNADEKYGNDPRITLRCADAATNVFLPQYDGCFVFDALPHFDSPEALFSRLYGALKSGGTLIVAHDRGRKFIDGWHEGRAKRVSNGLMHEDELAALLLAAGFCDARKKATDEIYYVSAVKP